jgi:hypothetical protein
VVFRYQFPNPRTEAFLDGTGPEPWWFPDAAGQEPVAAEGWLARAEGGGWRDLYGNSLADLVAILEQEGIHPRSQSPQFWTALLVGGLPGARYAAERP